MIHNLARSRHIREGYVVKGLLGAHPRPGPRITNNLRPGRPEVRKLFFSILDRYSWGVCTGLELHGSRLSDSRSSSLSLSHLGFIVSYSTGVVLLPAPCSLFSWATVRDFRVLGSGWLDGRREVWMVGEGRRRSGQVEYEV
ncbi:hypothetical protein K474DRAFT_1366302 [Panus rudis PR-1116 ss-1]|nr:hypothetical protein K474DRAFT_1366302 [Panus rudis PR-1116 ss-1]